MRVSSTTDPPNFRIEPTPYSLSSAAASGRGSCGAFGVTNALLLRKEARWHETE